MQNDSSFGGFFRQHKPLETGLLALGFALFIFLGARGLQKIGDMRVAAGEAQRGGTIQTQNEQYAYQPFQAALAAQPQQAALAPIPRTDPTKDQPKEAENKQPPQAKADEKNLELPVVRDIKGPKS